MFDTSNIQLHIHNRIRVSSQHNPTKKQLIFSNRENLHLSEFQSSNSVYPRCWESVGVSQPSTQKVPETWQSPLGNLGTGPVSLLTPSAKHLLASNGGQPVILLSQINSPLSFTLQE